mgnify:CR=1 FL=1
MLYNKFQIHRKMINSKEIKKALIVVWMVISSIIFIILIIPYIFPENSILSLIPECELKVKYNKECILCGMTRSFILISKGEIEKAILENKFSIYVYFAFLLNEILVILFLMKKFLNFRKEANYADA